MIPPADLKIEKKYLDQHGQEIGIQVFATRWVVIWPDNTTARKDDLPLGSDEDRLRDAILHVKGKGFELTAMEDIPVVDPYVNVPKINTLEELKTTVDRLLLECGCKTPVKLWVTFPNGNGIVPFHLTVGSSGDENAVYIRAFIDKSRVTLSDPSQGLIM